MYKNCESYKYVRDYLLDHVPHKILLKSREEGDVLIVANHDGAVFFLNSISKDFLKYCDGMKKTNEIIQIMLEDYDVSREILTDDIIEIIRKMQMQRILFFDPME